MPQTSEAHASGNMSQEELKAAEKVALSFVSAYKYYSLYPKGHAFSQNHLLRLQDDLLDFLNHHKSLRLDIDRYSIYYQGVPLINGSADESNPAYLLTRDRILYLEFDQNIRLSEITALFDIFNLHRNPLEEVDGDIATTLWHIPFNSIHYEAADIFAMEAIDFELSMFKPLPGGESFPDGTNTTNGLSNGSAPDQNRHKVMPFGSHDGTDQHYAGFYGNDTGGGMDSLEGPDSSAPGLLLVAKEKDLSELTTHEKLVLESYIQQEEERDLAGDVIDILLILLSVESDQIEFATVLDYLEFEFFEACARNEFHLLHKICKNIKNIQNVICAKKPWAISLINLFFTALAKEERYQQLPMFEQESYFSPDGEQLNYLMSTLDMLPAESIFILTALAAKTSLDNLRQRNELLAAIEKKVRTNPNLLLDVVQEANKEMCLFLLPAIDAMDKPEACRLYLAMTGQSFPDVRRIALECLFRLNCSPEPDQLLHLLGDEDDQIREKTLAYFETIGADNAGETIIRFLQSEDAQQIAPLHILQCYRILSRPLADSALEFLQDVLLGSKITSVFSKTAMIHKKGAAYALYRSGRAEARDIVRQGSESVRPDVRHACQKILEHT